MRKEIKGICISMFCDNKANYTTDGKRYCGVHDPTRAKVRQEQRDKKSKITSLRWRIKSKERASLETDNYMIYEYHKLGIITISKEDANEILRTHYKGKVDKLKAELKKLEGK